MEHSQMDSLDPPKTPDPLAVAILLWAALVLVPLGLRLTAEAGRTAWSQRLLRLVGWLQVPAAIMLSGSFVFDQGLPAAALALPWFAVTLLIASAGGLDLIRRGWRFDGSTAFAAAMLLLPVGGGWAVISRAGMQPQDFSHAIVILTAVHFHYAGFVLPILAGLTAKEMERRRDAKSPLPQPSPGGRCRQIDRTMLATIIAGVPLVGVGISLSPHIEVAAAILLASGCVLLAARQLQVAIAVGDATRLALLGVSSLALLSAMGLAVVYAAGEFTGQQWLSIQTMIRTHGAFNAIGFATCGVLGWTGAK
jgi:hypothetical protein